MKRKVESQVFIAFVLSLVMKDHSVKFVKGVFITLQVC